MRFFTKYGFILIVSLFYFLSSIYFVNVNCIAADEPFSIYFSNQSFYKICTELFSGNNPPFYEILLKITVKFTGNSVYSYRLPSILFASTTLVLFYLFLKRNYNQQAAIIFALLYSFSDYFISFTLEARTYSLLNLLLCISAIFFYNAYVKEKQKAGYCLIFINALLLFTHYLSALFILAQIITLIFSFGASKKILTAFYHYSITALLASPLIYGVFAKISTQKEMSPWPGPPNGIEDLYIQIWRFSNKPVIAVIILILLISVSLVKLLQKKAYKLHAKHLFLLCWFPLLFILMFFISYKIPMFVDRYLMLVALGFYASISVLISKTFTKIKYNWFIAVGVIILFASTHRWAIPNKRPLNKIVNWITQNTSQNSYAILSDYQMLHGIAYHVNKNCFIQKTKQESNQHLTQCLAEKNIGFGFKNVAELLVVEKNNNLSNEIKKQLADNNYVLVEESFLPEIFTLKKYRKQESVK